MQTRFWSTLLFAEAVAFLLSAVIATITAGLFDLAGRTDAGSLINPVGGVVNVCLGVVAFRFVLRRSRLAA